MATSSLVLGVLGLCFCWCPIGGIVLCTLAVIFGALRRAGLGLAGFVLGLIGLPLSIFLTTCILIALNTTK